MENEKLVAYLINGVLINILLRARGKHGSAWIAEDNTTNLGFRLHYGDTHSLPDKLMGGKLTPREATDGNSVVEDKKKQVAEYLIDSFRPTAEQAERIVNEAHEWRPPSRLVASLENE